MSVFDTNTFKTIKKIPVAKDPDFIFYDPKSKRVLVCHGDAAAITAIDPEKETVIGQVALGGGAEAECREWKGNRVRESGRGIGPSGRISIRESSHCQGKVSDHGMQNSHWARD